MTVMPDGSSTVSMWWSIAHPQAAHSTWSSSGDLPAIAAGIISLWSLVSLVGSRRKSTDSALVRSALHPPHLFLHTTTDGAFFLAMSVIAFCPYGLFGVGIGRVSGLQRLAC